MLLSVAVVGNPACFPNAFVGEVQKIFVLCVSKKAVFGSVVLALQKKKSKLTTLYSCLHKGLCSQVFCIVTNFLLGPVW